MNVSMLCYFHECSWWSVSTVVRMDLLFLLIRHEDSVSFFWAQFISLLFMYHHLLFIIHGYHSSSFGAFWVCPDV
jgi:hypothetical protein